LLLLSNQFFLISLKKAIKNNSLTQFSYPLVFFFLEINQEKPFVKGGDGYPFMGRSWPARIGWKNGAGLFIVRL